MGRYVDLNADLGEECGDDAAMLNIVSSANIACGGHAGGGEVLAQTVAEAARRGVNIGAHPSYEDRANFGRISHAADLEPYQIIELVTRQVQLVAGEAEKNGTVLSHVKAHGALYHDVMYNIDVAEAFMFAIFYVSRYEDSDATPYPVMGMPGSILENLAKRHGVEFIAEGFADRAYLPSGKLKSRSEEGSVLGEAEALDQAVGLALTKTVVDESGLTLPMPVDSICVHGDTPGAVNLAHDIVERLTLEGVWVKGF